MNIRNLLFIFISSVSLIIAGCGGTETPSNTNTANTTNVNAGNAARSNANSPVSVTTPTPDQVNNNAPILTPVYKAYCAAVVKKDDAAIRKFYTADTLKSFEETMKDEGVKTFSEFLKDDKISNEMCEVANERIKGDKAVAKVRTPAYPNGYDVLFIRENGEWKMSNITPEKGFQ